MANFLAAWWRTLPLRWHHLGRPYAQALGGYLAAYAGATALLRPWQLGGWWAIGVPLVAGFGVCWWLWRPWALLARNSQGESRRTPLVLVWVLCLALGWTVRQYLHARLGEVRDLRSVRELAQPGEAVYFRLHGPFYVAQADCGKFANTDFVQGKNSPKTYYANRYYACPLLPMAADTAASAGPILAWLGFRYHQELGQDLVGGELQWRFLNAVARLDARFDTLNLTRFAYLEREAEPLGYTIPSSTGQPLGGWPHSG